MSAMTEIRSRAVVLARPNIDTDQIIPARFLSTTERKGLGRHAFSDWRDDPAFPFGRAENAGRRILVAGRNFGCGSSREHAPWALTDLGVQAVISSEIADIFRGNALKNGLVPVVLEEAIVQRLMRRPDDELVIDIGHAELRTPAGDAHPFALDAFARTCLLEGVDELGWLLTHGDEIAAHESNHSQEFAHAR
ncbi:3-isopropylmalate dehydratase small subunit [Lysobacter pythonis]|uniref:3-isopropylmalate dehydratase n=1 Tax=Solilutibacter pythonis TaxID=2483112 RepID=A0A3M2HVR6_9GAMM|nr:3-isopropylmalate dehydratase small subunit [Lysobacter pythonis]RMH93108.1 3-isopropylmalate dehydratase small subunit [Lysobacter pythonis]